MANRFLTELFVEDIDQEKEFNDFLKEYGANPSMIEPYQDGYSIDGMLEAGLQADKLGLLLSY